jgi:hypothetical protein
LIDVTLLGRRRMGFVERSRLLGMAGEEEVILV